MSSSPPVTRGDPDPGPLGARARLENWIRVLGADFLLSPGPPTQSSPSRASQIQDVPTQPVPPLVQPAPESPRLITPPPSATSLAELQAEVSRCQACPLHVERRQTVFADGSSSARIFFVGEGPGADEDRTGIPFVGKAGQLLTRIIEGAMGMAREEVYIANVVKCRPPGNRNPSPEEQGRCGSFLQRQIALVDPEILVCLGAVAARHLLQTDLGAGRLRGRVHDYRGRPLVVTWHPAYLLRNPAAKRESWEDIKLVLRTLGLPEDPTPSQES